MDLLQLFLLLASLISASFGTTAAPPGWLQCPPNANNPVGSPGVRWGISSLFRTPLTHFCRSFGPRGYTTNATFAYYYDTPNANDGEEGIITVYMGYCGDANDNTAYCAAFQPHGTILIYDECFNAFHSPLDH